ncbi:FK506-binding protein-like [Nasonia vitripennis]|uniref:BDBT FKBP like N-terminal domain-containing protein n=1 Tax=Nasonia vitripennis TaxID=7425 RepID=A0A7M7LNY9_NASVI|nr:FK506-binding protein-like [Nasonia vitripennis]
MTTWESADKLIKKEIIREGQFSNKPTELSVCTIHVANPQSLDLSIEQMKENLYSDIIDADSKKVIVIGDACSHVDRYIERAIEMMSLNEHSLITVQFPPDRTRTETIILSLEVTLEKVDFHKRIWEWSLEEKYQTALKYKEKGVELFKAKRNVDAFHRFSKACKTLITLEPIEETDETMKNILTLKYVLYNNMAECQLIQENYEHTITLCNKVLSKEEKNVKALYRRGVAYGNIKDYEKSVNDLKIVVSIEPKNKKAQEKFNIFNERWRVSVQGYENIVRKMFKA